MKARHCATTAMPALLAALACGCSKSPTAASIQSSLDRTQVASVLSNAGTLVDDGIEENNAQVSAAAAAGPVKGYVTEAAIRPYAWWQNVTRETRTWTLAFTDSDSTGRPQTCIATLLKHMTGSLIIVPASPTDSTRPSTERITKPLDKTLRRMVRLERLNLGGTRSWKITGVTGGFVQTANATTDIVSLHLHSSSGVDTTITDPLQFFHLRSILAFGPNDTVTVTARAQRTDDAVFLHRWDWRHRLHDNLDGTYSFTWVTSAWDGWRHFAIQAMTHGSIDDDTDPYDSQAWHLPFRVTGGQPAVDSYP